MPAHQPSPPSLPPTSDADAESPQLLAMDRKNAIVADIEGISLGNNGRTVHLADGTEHACRVTTRDEEELDDWIERLILACEHFLPGR